MHDPQPRLRFIWQMPPVPPHHLIEHRYLPCLLSRLDVHRLRLRERDAREGLDLPREVGRVGAEGAEADRYGVERGQGGEGAYGR